MSGCIPFSTKVYVLVGLACLLSGCMKGVSQTRTMCMEWCAIEDITLQNPLGNCVISGFPLNDQEGVVSMRSEVTVTTYSLFGLANPSTYLDTIETVPIVEDGQLKVHVASSKRNLLDRLLVRIVPTVNYYLEAPQAINASLETQIGTIELYNVTGNIRATVSAGKISLVSPKYVYGNHELTMGTGEISISVSPDSAYQYDFSVDMGTINTAIEHIQPSRKFLGVHVTGLSGASITPGLLSAKVKFGTITLQSN